MKRRVWIRRRDRVRQRYWIGHFKRKSYGAFKFVSPWQQLKETTKIDPKTGEAIHGSVEPDYARFGAGKLKVGEDREIAKLQKELSGLIRQKVERQQLIKELETSKKVKFEEPQEQPKQSKIIIALKKKVENVTPEQIVQRHKTAAGELRKQERDELKERFVSEKKLTPEVASIAIQKYNALLLQDPRGRSLGMDYIFNRAAKLAADESKGKQKVIPGVKTYQDSDYIQVLMDAGYAKHDAESKFFSAPQEEVSKRTPQQFIAFIEKMEQPSLPESLSIDRASEIIDDLVQRRPDLKQHNRITLINKLRQDLKESEKLFKQMDVRGEKEVGGILKDFFNVDKPLKEVLEDEIKSEANQ